MNAELLKNLPPKLAAIIEAAEATGAHVSVRRINGGVEAEVAGDKVLRGLLGILGLDMDKEAERARTSRRLVARDLLPTLRSMLYDAEVALADVKRRQVDPSSDEHLNAVHRRISVESLLNAMNEGARDPADCACEGRAPAAEQRAQSAAPARSSEAVFHTENPDHG